MLTGVRIPQPKYHDTITICDWYHAHFCQAKKLLSNIFCSSNSMKLGHAARGRAAHGQFQTHTEMPYCNSILLWASLQDYKKTTDTIRCFKICGS